MSCDIRTPVRHTPDIRSGSYTCLKMTWANWTASSWVPVHKLYSSFTPRPRATTLHRSIAAEVTSLRLSSPWTPYLPGAMIKRANVANCAMTMSYWDIQSWPCSRGRRLFIWSVKFACILRTAKRDLNPEPCGDVKSSFIHRSPRCSCLKYRSNKQPIDSDLRVYSRGTNISFSWTSSGNPPRAAQPTLQVIIHRLTEDYVIVYSPDRILAYNLLTQFQLLAVEPLGQFIIV